MSLEKRVIEVLAYIGFEGGELVVKKNTCIEFSGDGFAGYGGCPPRRESLQGFIAIPGLCNAHSHLLDYSMVEAGEGLELESLVAHPAGLKYRVLQSLREDTLVERLEEASKRLEELGVLVVASYAELGEKGVKILLEAFRESRAHLDLYPQPLGTSLEDYIALLEKHGALGLDTILSLGDRVGEVAEKALHLGAVIQVHVSETRQLYSSRDYEKAIVLGKNGVAVHATYLELEELETLLREMRGVVFCPASNKYHVGRQPDFEAVFRLWRKGYTNMALGTDNAAWNTLDPLVEAREVYIEHHSRVRSSVEGFLEMLFSMITASCLDLVETSREEYSKKLVLVELPEAKWSENTLATLVKRGAWRTRRIIP